MLTILLKIKFYYRQIKIQPFFQSFERGIFVYYGLKESIFDKNKDLLISLQKFSNGQLSESRVASLLG